MSARRPPGPPPREGRLAFITALVLTVAVPGVGHLYMNLLVRGLIWLAGNIAILLILVQGDVETLPLFLVLAAIRGAALIDLVVLLRAPGRRG
jgi:hypothetical protein